MNLPLFYPGIATVLAVLLYLFFVYRVGRMRARHGIAAPATTGHPDYERAYRVQMNTLEQMIAFLPMLWLFALLIDPEWAGGLGLLWVAARVHYAMAYLRDPATRGPGMLVSLLVTSVLILGAIWGLVVLAF